MPAPNPSGFAPEGVIEYALGSLRPGQRFVTYGFTRESDLRGQLLRTSPCSCFVELDRAGRVREFDAVDGATGEIIHKAIPAGPRREHWACSTPVGVEADTDSVLPSFPNLVP